MGERVPTDAQADVLSILKSGGQPFHTPKKRLASRMSPHWVYRYFVKGAPRYTILREGRAALSRYRSHHQQKGK